MHHIVVHTMVQNTATPDDESPEIGSSFVHQQTGERVEVVEHMFQDEADTPFVVRRESDGEEIGFETPEQFFSEYESERTETKRFDDDEQFDASSLIEGDRIDPSLVARTPEQLGETIKPAHPEGDQPPKTRLVTASILNGMDDTHSAILVDGDSGLMVRAHRHDSSQAWSQKEADWKVSDVGEKVVVDDVHELTVADNDTPVEDDAKYIQEWANVVLGDMASGYFDYVDEVKMSGSTLTLSDHDGRKGMATISLE